MGIIHGFLEGIVGLVESSGFVSLGWQNYVMVAVSFVLLYLAIAKEYEPLILLPLAFGMLLVNLYPSIMGAPSTEFVLQSEYIKTHDVASQSVQYATTVMNGEVYYNVPTYGGLLYYLYQGVKMGIYPPLIFLGIGAMTDFGPLIANPKSFILGAAAQLGIFFTFFGAIFLGFTQAQAGSIGIIGGADGPTSIYVTTKLAENLLGPIAVAAYSYMALVPVIQPPIMKLFTTEAERKIQMTQLRDVSKREKIVFPLMILLLCVILLPSACPLLGALCFGNLCKECGVVERLSDTMQNALINIVTIFLGLSVGSKLSASQFLTVQTLFILLLGVIAFSLATAAGVLMAKLMNLCSKEKINPLIGSAGVSAVPMAARVSNKVGLEANPQNFLLMHAMGPNVSGVIGSAVAAGVLLALCH